jgi:hypothetical protein
MEQEQSDDLTKQGIAALKSGDKRTAAQFLHQATKLNPFNQMAWLWLSGCVDSLEDKQFCLKKVIAIDATNEAGKRASKGLEKLAAIESPAIEDLIPLKQQINTQQLQDKSEVQAPSLSNTSKEKKKLSKKKKLFIGCLSVLGLLLFCCFLGMLVPEDARTTTSTSTNTPIPERSATPFVEPLQQTLPSLPTNTPKPEYSAIDAELICQQFIEKRLKAPATAKYAPLGNEDAVEFLGENTYKVFSYVDSQNSFGAMLRTKYLCIVQYIGDDNWKLISLATED